MAAPVSRAGEIGRGLVRHLRATLEAPGLELAEPPTPLTGGFDTEIFALRLREAPPAWSGALVLRLLRAHHDPAMVLREQATQNTVSDLGYPAPRVRLASIDPTLLGAPFVLMDRLPGIPLMAAGLVGMDRTLLDAQLRLHGLDPAPLTRVLGDAVSFEGYLTRFERRVDQGELDGLRAAMHWLRDRRPPPAALAICHGDLHPQNILVEHGRVTGVLDWPNVVVADPAFDLAATCNILRFVPAGLTEMPAVLRWLGPPRPAHTVRSLRCALPAAAADRRRAARLLRGGRRDTRACAGGGEPTGPGRRAAAGRARSLDLLRAARRARGAGHRGHRHPAADTGGVRRSGARKARMSPTAQRIGRETDRWI